MDTVYPDVFHCIWTGVCEKRFLHRYADPLCVHRYTSLLFRTHKKQMVPFMGSNEYDINEREDSPIHVLQLGYLGPLMDFTQFDHEINQLIFKGIERSPYYN